MYNKKHDIQNCLSCNIDFTINTKSVNGLQYYDLPIYTLLKRKYCTGQTHTIRNIVKEAVWVVIQ